MEDFNFCNLFYYVLTEYGRWGRSIDLDEARKNAGITKLGHTYHFIHTLIVKGDCTDDEVMKLGYCFGVNSWGQVVECKDLPDADKALLDAKFVGWSSKEVCTNKQLKERAKEKKKQEVPA